MKRVRLRFPIIVNYLSLIGRIAFIALTSIIIARKLSVFEYSIWGIVLSLAMLYKAPMSLWVFWCKRYVRRGSEESYATGLVITLVWLLAVAAVHVLVSTYFGFILGEGAFYYMLMGLVYIVLLLLYQYQLSIISVILPEYIGYSNILYSFVRFGLIFSLVYLFKMAYIGVLLASALNVLVIAFFLFLKIRDTVVLKKPDFSLAKRWFKMFPAPLFNTLSQNLASIDRAAVTAFSSNEVPAAYLTISYSLTLPVKIDLGVISSLYARLLGGKSSRDVVETIKVISIPLWFSLATLIVLGKPLLSLMNPRYVDAYPVLLVVSIVGVLGSYLRVYFNSINAVDRIDVKEGASTMDLLKSDLFKAIFVNFLKNLSAIILGIVFLITARDSPESYALAFPLGFLVATPPSLAWMAYKAKKIFRQVFPAEEVLKMVVSASLAGIYYHLVGAENIVVKSFFQDSIPLLFHLAVGGAIYILSMLAMSSWFRSLARASVRFVLGVFR